MYFQRLLMFLPTREYSVERISTGCQCNSWPGAQCSTYLYWLLISLPGLMYDVRCCLTDRQCAWPVGCRMYNVFPPLLFRGYQRADWCDTLLRSTFTYHSCSHHEFSWCTSEHSGLLTGTSPLRLSSVLFMGTRGVHMIFLWSASLHLRLVVGLSPFSYVTPCTSSLVMLLLRHSAQVNILDKTRHDSSGYKKANIQYHSIAWWSLQLLTWLNSEILIITMFSMTPDPPLCAGEHIGQDAARLEQVLGAKHRDGGGA